MAFKTKYPNSRHNLVESGLYPGFKVWGENYISTGKRFLFLWYI